jgi:riboflavin biosynthesis pyrimidine reductase
VAFLGVELDLRANRAAEPDAELAGPSSRARVHVIRAREDVIAARAARSLV